MRAAQALAFPSIDAGARTPQECGRLLRRRGKQARREQGMPPPRIEPAGALALAFNARLRGEGAARRSAAGNRSCRMLYKVS